LSAYIFIISVFILVASKNINFSITYSPDANILNYKYYAISIIVYVKSTVIF